LTIHQLAVAFLNHKGNLLGAGDHSRRMWAQHEQTRDLILKPLGRQHLVSYLRPDDFAVLRRKLARRWKPVTLRKLMQRVRIAIAYLADKDLIDRPVRHGQDFKRPSKRTLRLEKFRQSHKLCTVEELHRLPCYLPSPLGSSARVSHGAVRSSRPG
jgi:hypothetical protein